jgi:hypothetical protein
MVLYSAIKDLALNDLLETIQNVWCCLDANSKQIYINQLRLIRDNTKENVYESQQLKLPELVNSTG